MENTETLNIRISKELKQTLEKQAQQKSQTISDYVRDILARHVLQDDSGMNGISQETMKQIEVEAKRRGISTAELIARLVSAAFGRLRKNTSPNIFILD